MSAGGGVSDYRDNNKITRACITINLNEGEDWNMETLKLLVSDLKPAFFIAGKEVAPTTGRKHFQCYFEHHRKDAKKGKTITNAIRRHFPLPRSVHVEPARGSAEDNVEYCSKEDKEPFIVGEPTGNNGSGSRTDLVTIAKMITKKEKTLKEIAEEYSDKYVVYYKGFQQLKKITTKGYKGIRRLLFIWGPTGNGKTSHAVEELGDPQPVEWVKSGFMNNYNGEETVLFDDFDHSQMDPKRFLTLTDRYPTTVNVKGGDIYWDAQLIAFTSNDDPKTWFKDRCAPETLEAIHRRMDEFGIIKHLGEKVAFDKPLLKSESSLVKWLARGGGLETKAAAIAEDAAQEVAEAAAELVLMHDQDTEEQLPAVLRTNSSAGRRITPAAPPPSLEENTQIIDLTFSEGEEEESEGEMSEEEIRKRVRVSKRKRREE